MGERNKIYYGIFIAVIVLCGICYAFLYAAKDKDESDNLVVDEVQPQQAETATTQSAEEPDMIYVQLSGAVVTPGVYEVEKGRRVFEALEMAGGLAESADDQAVNQARILTDGEMIYFPTREEISTGTYQAQQSRVDNGLININQASRDELMNLPGIGESRADAIINYRTSNGPFESPEEIMEIEGIKEAMFEKIKDSITI